MRQPSYFEHLSTVLADVPLADLKAWLLSHILRASAAYLTDDFVETNFDFYGRTLNGTPELRARWKRGVGRVEGALGEAFTLSGDLQIIDGTLHVQLDPASAPRRSKALAALCTELTDTTTRYPGTDLTLAYSVKGYPQIN